MANTRDISWKRLATEATVIVGSILFAFAIDAWWQDRGSRATEAAAIAGLVRDFEANSLKLEDHRKSNQRRFENAEKLLGATGPAARSVDFDVIHAIGIIGTVNQVHLSNGTLETILSNDGLALFQNSELRNELANWLQLSDGVGELNQFVAGEAGALISYMRTRYPMREMDRATGLVDLPPSAFQVDVNSLLSDLEFANVIYMQWYATKIFVAKIDVLIDALGKVQAILDGYEPEN